MTYVNTETQLLNAITEIVSDYIDGDESHPFEKLEALENVCAGWLQPEDEKTAQIDLLIAIQRLIEHAEITV